MKKKYLIFLVIVLRCSFSMGQSWLWGRQGTTGADARSISADVQGNVYFGLAFADSISFNNFHLTGSHIGVACLVKYDSNGNVIWTRQPNPNYFSVGIGCLADVSGKSVYFTGEFTSQLFFGSDTLTSKISTFNGDIFLVKYTSSGTLLWAKQSKSISSRCRGVGPECLATDHLGNVYVTGVFHDTVSFGSFTLKDFGAYGEMFLVKYDANGNVLWAKQSNAPNVFGAATGYSVTTDISDNVLVTGIFKDTLAFGNDSLRTTDTYNGNGFLVKYDSAGNEIWARQANNPTRADYAFGYSVITDAAKNIYETGFFYTKIVFGSDTLKNPPMPGGAAFLVKYSANGNLIWAKQSHCSYNRDSVMWEGYSLAIDNRDNIYWSLGEWEGSGDFIFGQDTLAIRNQSYMDAAIVMKLDTSGRPLCGSIICSGGDDFNSVTTAPSGRYVYLGGDIMENVVFNMDTLHTSGEYPFVARWQPCSSPEGLNEPSPKNISSIIYPNPSNGKFIIELSSEKQSEERVIEVYNMLGEKVYQASLNPYQGGTSNTTISLASEVGGIYLYRIISHDGQAIASGKLMIER